jgi:hypothetical protein
LPCNSEKEFTAINRLGTLTAPKGPAIYKLDDREEEKERWRGKAKKMRPKKRDPGEWRK